MPLLHPDIFEGTGLVIDADDSETSSWPRFVNHSKRRANCELIEMEWEPLGPVTLPPTVLMLQATRRIAAGEQLLISYGDQYWDTRADMGRAPGRWSPGRFASSAP